MSAELAAAIGVIADWQDARYAETATTPEDDGTEAEALAPVEVPRSSSQAGLAALRYRVVA